MLFAQETKQILGKECHIPLVWPLYYADEAGSFLHEKLAKDHTATVPRLHTQFLPSYASRLVSLAVSITQIKQKWDFGGHPRQIPVN